MTASFPEASPRAPATSIHPMPPACRARHDARKGGSNRAPSCATGSADRLVRAGYHTDTPHHRRIPRAGFLPAGGTRAAGHEETGLPIERPASEGSYGRTHGSHSFPVGSSSWCSDDMRGIVVSDI